MIAAVAATQAQRYSGSLRIIPIGCSLGSFPGPAPAWDGALPIDLPDSQLHSCSGHRVLSSRRSKQPLLTTDRKSTRLNSSHQIISYAVFCLKKKTKTLNVDPTAMSFGI